MHLRIYNGSSAGTSHAGGYPGYQLNLTWLKSIDTISGFSSAR
jgi:hypothetical protein